MISQDLQNDLPPKMFMMQIMDSLAKIYCFLWDNKDKDNKIKINWDTLNKHFHKNNFRSNIRKLNEKGLLDYEENHHEILITLVSWDEIEDRSK